MLSKVLHVVELCNAISVNCEVKNTEPIMLDINFIAFFQFSRNVVYSNFIHHW